MQLDAARSLKELRELLADSYLEVFDVELLAPKMVIEFEDQSGCFVRVVDSAPIRAGRLLTALSVHVTLAYDKSTKVQAMQIMCTLYLYLQGTVVAHSTQLHGQIGTPLTTEHCKVLPVHHSTTHKIHTRQERDARGSPQYPADGVLRR